LDPDDITSHSAGKSVSFKELQSIRAIHYSYMKFKLKSQYLPTIGNSDILPKNYSNPNNNQYKQLMKDW
jgi:hypothetical protein